MYKIRLKKGDTVIVRAGKYKGQTGTVIATDAKNNTVLVEGINVVKKHLKPTKKHPQGGIVDVTKPINVSKVGFFDAHSKKAVRIGFTVSKDNKKKRINLSTKKEIA